MYSQWRNSMNFRKLGTKLGVLVLIIYFLFQCEIADAPTHEMMNDKMYYDAPLREEIERTA